MNTLKRGVLISIEGIDGSGKSTLAKNVHLALGQAYQPTILTKEPGGTPLGKRLRSILQTQNVPICNKAEFLLFAADRAQHFDELIVPLLHNNYLIISDRMADSSLVYQGYARGLDTDMIKSVNAWAMNNIQPDLTVYVRIEAECAFQRLRKRNEELTAFEREKTDFFQKLVQGFDSIFSQRSNVIQLDGTLDKRTLTATTIEKINLWLQQHNLR